MNPFYETFFKTFFCLFFLALSCATPNAVVESVQEVVTFAKLSDFPITMNGGLSALAGDSLILKDNLAPAGKYSAINVSDPSHPEFAGYVDSTALLSYPVKTLLPVFLKYGVANSLGSRMVCSYGDKILMIMDPCLKRYQIQNNNLVLIDSLVIDPIDSLLFLQTFIGRSIFLLDTTVLAVLGDNPAINYRGHKLLPISLAGFSMLPICDLGISVDAMSNCEKLEINIQGIINNRIFVSTNDIHCDPMMKQYTQTNEIIYDLSLNQISKKPSSYINGCNTGCYISATEALSITFEGAGTELFVSYANNFYSYEFALSHNGVYLDNIHTKDQLNNILLDTNGQKVYLVFSNNITILSYQRKNI